MKIAFAKASIWSTRNARIQIRHHERKVLYPWFICIVLNVFEAIVATASDESGAKRPRHILAAPKRRVLTRSLGLKNSTPGAIREQSFALIMFLKWLCSGACFMFLGCCY